MDSLSTENAATTRTQPDDTPSVSETVDSTEQSAHAESRQDQLKAARAKWFTAFKNVLPIYISIHLAFFVITCLAVLFIIPDFPWKALPINTLWQSWNRWDSLHYSYLATHGYTDWWRTVFFPLFPLLERYVAVLTGDPFIAGLIISNVAGLGMLVVLYRLVEEDFDSERAYRTALYLSVFPAAFFFAAAYTEALFLLLALLSFYYIRQGSWWLAGAFGFFAMLTRSTAILLLVPFCYEYLRQHQFKLKNMRFDVFGGALIVAALGLFMLYCYHRFHSFIPFARAEPFMWSRDPQTPWFLIKNVIAGIAQSNGFLSFHALRNIIDASQILLILALVILAVVGPWRFPSRLWVYAIYGIVLFVILQVNPVKVNPIRGPFPLQAFPRYMLEVFPAFIVLAALGKYRTVHLSYLMVSGVVLFVLLSLFLTGHWVV